MTKFTAQEQKDAEFAVTTAIAVRQTARALECKRDLTDEEVLARVPEPDRERFRRGKTLYHAGAYNPE